MSAVLAADGFSKWIVAVCFSWSNSTWLIFPQNLRAWWVSSCARSMDHVHATHVKKSVRCCSVVASEMPETCASPVNIKDIGKDDDGNYAREWYTWT